MFFPGRLETFTGMTASMRSSRNMTRKRRTPQSLGDQKRKWQKKLQLCGSTFSDTGKDCILSSPRPSHGPQERGCTLRMEMHKNTFTSILGWWLQAAGEKTLAFEYCIPSLLVSSTCLFTPFFQASAPTPPPTFSSLSCGGAPPESNVHKADLLSCTTFCLKCQPHLKV
ncbi:PREDICTED: bis(5'-adenosyl)-triphosphatase isoform X1 [Mandrillus leucophaeus]|uniref:bis(5'-adenosyl)-triphosphatase isoform X1 n=1 Tax=Mandrillus leucophaeus TaxID=9568 RepID=UPI0005F4F3A6|nr:PREDICTED: bis(5'-adenosyl)-triphosphatase isoform X1 [Mandrillus leucophaeus]